MMRSAEQGGLGAARDHPAARPGECCVLRSQAGRRAYWRPSAKRGRDLQRAAVNLLTPSRFGKT